MKIEMPRLNDGRGLYDEVGLCGQLITILNDVEVKGARNMQLLMLVIQGLQKLQEGLQKKESEEHGEDHSSVADA